MKINEPATYDMIRGKYRSMEKACVAFGMSKRGFYLAISGAFGGKSHPAPKTEAVLKRLKDEGLLVYLPDESVDTAVNQ